MIEQFVENLPDTMRTARRWFPVKQDKKPSVRAWQKAETQQNLSDVTLPAGYFAGPKEKEPSLLVLDFDKVLDKETGKWKSTQAKLIFDRVLELSGKTFAEKSLSGRGVHIYLSPSYFPKISKNIHKFDPCGQLELYHGGNHYFIPTGVVIGCDPRTQIVTGSAADAAAKYLLDTLPELIDNKKGNTDEELPAAYDDGDLSVGYGDRIPTDADRAKAMLDFIPCKEQSYEDWLNVGFALKDAGCPVEEWEEWSATDPERFKVDECVEKWRGFNKKRKRVTIATLHEMAKKYGYDEAEFRRQWAKAHKITVEEAFANVPLVRVKWPVTYANGKPIKAAPENFNVFLSRCQITVRKNVLKRTLEITAGGSPVSMSLDAVATIIRGKAHESGLPLTKSEVFDALEVAGERAKYNPVAEWLKICKKEWNGEPGAFDDLFRCIHLQEGEDEDLARALLRRWLISAARLAFNDEAKNLSAAQGVLCLTGAQGIGKTRFCLALSPFSAWSASGLSLNPKNKDSIMAVTGFWIVELGEAPDTMRKERVDALKAFFTRESDTIRRPYMHCEETVPRHTVFLMTTNEERFLPDRSGNRRFWPLRVAGFDFNHLPALESLWGEIVSAADAGEPHYLAEAENAALAGRSEKFETVSAVEAALLDKLKWSEPPETWRLATAAEICEEIGFTPNYTGRVGRALQYFKKSGKFSAIELPTNNMDRSYLVPPRAFRGFPSCVS